MIKLNEDQLQSLDRLIDAAVHMQSAHDSYGLIQQWYEKQTQYFSVSLDHASFVAVLHQLIGLYQLSEIAHILKYDIDTKEKINSLLTCMIDEQEKFDPIMFYYFISCATPAGQGMIAALEHLAGCEEYRYMVDFIVHTSEDLRDVLLPVFLRFSAERHAMVDLYRLKQQLPSCLLHYAAVLGSQLTQQLSRDLAFTAPQHAADYFTKLYLGEIDVETAQFICAAIAIHKKYAFNPIVLEINEIERFAENLQQRHALSYQGVIYFILMGVHSISGCVDMRTEGTTVCLIDSFGYGDGLEQGFFTTSAYTIKQFLFFMPNAKLYFMQDSRQHARHGCSVYAIDDVRHLHTLDGYLPPSGNKCGLVPYLEVHSRPLVLENGETIYLASMPLSLLRTMQTRDLFAVMKARADEASLPVNKRGESSTESVLRLFNPAQGVKRNQRINHKLAQFTHKALRLLQTHDDSAIAALMNQLSLDAFEQANQSARPILSK